jgi:hypothetical protein
MKKLMSFLAIMFVMALFVQNVNAQLSGTANFNLSMTVEKYIETAPSPLNWNFGTTTHIGKREQLNGNAGEWNLAYTNCPFSITISGNNMAGDGVPRFARVEEGTGDFDILTTLYEINFTTNGSRSLFFGSDGPKGASHFPYTKSYTEAPHNGQVKMDMKAYVNSHLAVDEGIPIRLTIIDPTFTGIQSADAGDYTCTMVVTLAEL